MSYNSGGGALIPAACFALGFGACWLMFKYEGTLRKLLNKELGEQPKVVHRALSDLIHHDDNESVGKTSYQSAATANGMQ